MLTVWIGLSSPVLTKTKGLKWSYRVMSSTWWWYQCHVMTHPLTWALIGLLCALGIGVAQDNIIYFPITFAMVCMLTEVWEGELRRFSSFQLILQTLFIAVDDVRWIVFLFEQLDDAWKNFNRVFLWFVWSGRCLRTLTKFYGIWFESMRVIPGVPDPLAPIGLFELISFWESRQILNLCGRLLYLSNNGWYPSASSESLHMTSAHDC